MNRRRTNVASALLAALAISLLAAPAALAENGTGLAGPLTDKTVTFFCFGVIIFFAALPIVLSLIQRRLEKQKGSAAVRPQPLRLSPS